MQPSIHSIIQQLSYAGNTFVPVETIEMQSNVSQSAAKTYRILSDDSGGMQDRMLMQTVTVYEY